MVIDLVDFIGFPFFIGPVLIKLAVLLAELILLCSQKLCLLVKGWFSRFSLLKRVDFRLPL
jgi:hypothetical protein